MWPDRSVPNACAWLLGRLHPSFRRRGRYVLENDERVDVLVARSVPTIDGTAVEFERLWDSRATIALAPGVDVVLPSVDGLILTKQVAARPKDLEDVRLLRLLKSEEDP